MINVFIINKISSSSLIYCAIFDNKGIYYITIDEIDYSENKEDNINDNDNIINYIKLF